MYYFRDVRERRKKAINKEVKDVLLEEIQKMKDLLKGINLFNSNPNEVMKIYRIKGLTRFEDELEKGIFSVYISPNAE